MSSYHKIDEASYRKLLFQLRGQFTSILNVFKCYGMDAHVDEAIEECMRVSENFGQAVRGDDAPIHILHELKPRITE